MTERTVDFTGTTGRVEDAASGLWVQAGSPPRMDVPHRHNDIEVNFVVEGALEYQFGGRPFHLCEGEIAVFWAALPHRLLPSSSGKSFWIHMPLSSVLGWHLSSEDVSQLLSLRPLVAAALDLPYDAARMFGQWNQELQDPPRAPIAEVEAQGMIRRILRESVSAESSAPTDIRDDSLWGTPHRTGLSVSHPGRLAHVSALSQYIAENYKSELSVPVIADSQGLSPSYAMAVFKSVTGMSLGRYLSWCRISEAQRLLVTTDMSISDVIAEAGFTSQSSFYARFSAECGITPRDYRKTMSPVSR